jgi:hypothetical protein
LVGLMLQAGDLLVHVFKFVKSPLLHRIQSFLQLANAFGNLTHVQLNLAEWGTPKQLANGAHRYLLLETD